MPTRNISLTPQMDKAVKEWIKSGQYANASEWCVPVSGHWRKTKGKKRPSWRHCVLPLLKARRVPSVTDLP